MRHQELSLRMLTVISIFLLVLVTSTTSVAGGANRVGVPFTPSLIARAGQSSVLYVVSQSTACTQRECMRLDRSNNGGETFFAVSMPPVTAIRGMNVPPISGLFFANPDDGYAEEYGSTGTKWTTSALFATFNGGRTWQSVAITPHPSIYGFAASSRYFYALTDQCTARGRCSADELSRSRVGTTKWTRLSIPRAIRKYSNDLQIAAFGSSVWLTTQQQSSAPYSSYVGTSVNGGESFTVRAQPLLQSANECDIQPASSAVVWAECDDGMMQGDILYSDDGGSEFGVEPHGKLAHFGFGVFDAVSPSIAYFINEQYPRSLFRTSSGSANARSVGTLARDTYWFQLDMTSGPYGLALSDGPGGSNLDRLWRTVDDGRQWSRVNI
jgi:hypothetical protein